MIDLTIINNWLDVILVLVIVSGALIVIQRDLIELVNTYAAQSFLLVILAFVIFSTTKSTVLIYLALLTLVSKVILLPYFIKKTQKEIHIKRDLEFSYLNPTGSLIVTLGIVLIVLSSFSVLIPALGIDKTQFFGAMLGISLMFIGLLVVMTRKKMITKIIGYLTIENGVLLFSLFVAELPFLVEVLLIVDLMMLVLLAAILAIGIDSSLESVGDRFKSLDWIYRGGDNR